MTRVVMTGADGFIGGWLKPELEAAGHVVIPSSEDIRSHGFKLPPADVCIHLAARVGRLRCDANQADVISTNVSGTMRVAQECASNGTRLLYVSSSEAAYNVNLYGLSKRWGEEVAQLYAPEGLQTLRLFMPYGEGLPPGYGRASLVNFIQQALCGETLTVHRGASRSWCYITDTVRAVRMILESNSPGLWNVGRTDNETTMLEVARNARALCNSSSSIKVVLMPPGTVAAKDPDNSRLLGIGWYPEVELTEGMERIRRWLSGG